MTLALHWFRNDLRLRDNRALAQAARESDALVPVFVLDERILRSPRRRGTYPAPIVAHAERRQLALSRYQAARAVGAAP